MLIELLNFIYNVPLLLYLVPRILLCDLFNGIVRAYYIVKPTLDYIGIAYLADDIIDYLSVYSILFTRNIRAKSLFIQLLTSTTITTIDKKIPSSFNDIIIMILKSNIFNYILIMLSLLCYVLLFWLNKDLNINRIILYNSDGGDNSNDINNSRLDEESSDIVTTDETSEVSINVASSNKTTATAQSLTSSRKSKKPSKNIAVDDNRSIASSTESTEIKRKKGGVRLDVSGSIQQANTPPRHPPSPQSQPHHSILKSSPPSSVSSASQGRAKGHTLQYNTDINSLNTLVRNSNRSRTGSSDGGSSNGSNKGRLEYLHVLSPRQNKELEEETIGTPYSRVASSSSANSTGGKKLLLGIGELGNGNDSSSEDTDDDHDDEGNASDTGSRAGSVSSERSLMSVRSTQSRNDEHISSHDVVNDSVENPKVLIGWRILIKGYGMGVVLSLRKQRFSTTQFNIQLENGNKVTLPLKRSAKKGSVPFTLVAQVK